MASVEDVIKKIKRNKDYKAVISMTDMNMVSEKLRSIAADAGLGVALLVAWQHGLKIGHIPLEYDDDKNEKEEQARVIAASAECPYMFVHVPIRQIRSDKPGLVKRGIMNPHADPSWFVYHEDGLIGTFSFPDLVSADLTEEDIREILDTLAQQGVLMRANINNRQIQFKDLVAKRRIEESGEKVYVRVEDQPLEKGRLPVELNWEDAWDYVAGILGKRSACNYCSAPELLQHEVTIHSARAFSRAGRWKDDLATVRNYQLGFTFAPFGDPREVCHFLAWDFPHINDLVMNMEPQTYSCSDLIRLVRLVNRAIREFWGSEADPPEPIAGGCNHWAGNTIYHQHYQFVRIADLPLVSAPIAETTIEHNAVKVRKFQWPSPAFLITSSEEGRDQEVMDVADRVAREWRILSEGEDRSYANGIAIRDHTQNTFVTLIDGRISAIFIPRDRGKIDTSDPENLIEGKPIQKKNAGVLEMMGYFVIDNPDEFDRLCRRSSAAPEELRDLGKRWLSDLAPKSEAIKDFENNIRICLSKAVTTYEEQIDELLDDSLEDLRPAARVLASNIEHDENLDDAQRKHLYRELVSAVLDYRAAESDQEHAG